MKTHFIEHARVVGPEGQVEQVRAVAVDERLMIFERDGQQVRLQRIVPIASVVVSSSPKSEPHVVTDAGGDTWQVWAAGCGCGSPLKRFGVGDAIALAGEA